MDRYYKCYCHNCGWSGMSNNCNGGEHNGIDYTDIYCPICDYVEPDDYGITIKEWVKIILRWVTLKFMIKWVKKNLYLLWERFITKKLKKEFKRRNS